MSQTPFKEQLETCFLTGSSPSRNHYLQMMDATHEQILTKFASRTQPYSGLEAREFSNRQQNHQPLFQAEGVNLYDVLQEVGDEILSHSVVVTNPTCIAHLQCPPLVSTLAAEAMISATNQSMDSWDQSPAATFVEQQIVEWLCERYGYGKLSDGVFTSGGTMSNFMGVMLARNEFAMTRLGWSIQKNGTSPEVSKMRILCSETAHFTILKSCAMLGLGEQAVVVVETDESGRMRVDKLKDKLATLEAEGLLPFAVVATAGTTDFGSIDPMEEIAQVAKTHGLWMHVDAAYGGALAVSNQHQHLLRGIEQADSITVDFHKLFFQPISCGAFLLRNRNHFDSMRLHADYLNPEDDEEDGVPSLVTKSTQTTRRFDALKLYISLKTTGLQALGEMIDYTLGLAQETAQYIEGLPNLQLINRPTLNTVVFRYIGGADDQADRVNTAIRDILLSRGDAVIARTRHKGRVCLKFTLLNPLTTLAQMVELLDQVQSIGQELERQTS